MSRLALIALLSCAAIAGADEPRPPATADAPDENAEPAGSAGRRFETIDRLDLDRTAITGNQELPKVLYIVPWKKALAGELPQPPLSSLLEEVLAPVDREVFRRQVSYFDALHSEEQ
jgi:hypothetical protein